MYTIKEMKFPIFITLDESGVHSTGEQMYKLVIQDANLETSRIECSSADYLASELSFILKRILTTENKENV